MLVLTMTRVRFFFLSSRIISLVFIAVFLLSTTSSTEVDNRKEEQDDDHLLVQETVQAGRGHRDTRGERDQWASTEHLKTKFDSRRPISAQVQALLERYRLECTGCDHDEAVAKINAFVEQARAEDAKRQQQKVWRGRMVNSILILLIGAAIYFKTEIQGYLNEIMDDGYRLGGASNSGESRSDLMKIHRERAAKAAEERSTAAAAAEAKLPPTWREQEEKEIWTRKQEKQFAKALHSFGGVPAKARYILIAEKVEGKSRCECLLHHKLLMLREKEAKEE